MKLQVQKNPPDLQELLTHSLAPVPHCLRTLDGFFAKNNKVSMLHLIHFKDNDKEVKHPSQLMFIQDGNPVFCSTLGLAPTCAGVSLQMLGQMAQKQHLNTRGTPDQLIFHGPTIRLPNDFKLFFCQVIGIRNSYATC